MKSLVEAETTGTNLNDPGRVLMFVEGVEAKKA